MSDDNIRDKIMVVVTGKMIIADLTHSLLVLGDSNEYLLIPQRKPSLLSLVTAELTHSLTHC